MATRAELAAELSLNITPFQRALAHATSNAKEFAGKAGETGKEIEKGLLGKDLSTLLGIGGATLAFGAFAEKLKDFVGDSIKDFGKMETATLKLALALHNPFKAAGIAETAESKAGPGYGTAEQVMASTQALTNAGFAFAEKGAPAGTMTGLTTGVSMKGHAAGAGVPQSGDQLQDALADLNVLNDKGIAEMSETIRKWTIKGGEGKTAARLFEGIPELEPEVAKRIKASGGVQTPEDWVKSNIKTADSLKNLITDTARSYNDPTTGKTPRQQKGETTEGTIEKLNAEIAKMRDAIGSDLAPEFKKILGDFQTDIPAITKVLDTSFRALASFIDDMLTGHGLFQISSTPSPDNPLNQVQKWWTTNVLPETQKNSDAGLLKDIHDAIEKTNELIGKTVKDSPLGDVF